MVVRKEVSGWYGRHRATTHAHARERLMVPPRRGGTFIDIIVTMGGTIGAGIMPVILIKTTALPLWAGILIGLPVGMIFGWLAGAIAVYGICAVLLIVSRVMLLFRR